MSSMLSQVLRTRRHTLICRLHIHQRFNRTLSSTTSEEDKRPPIHFRPGARRTAFIRTWEPFHNLADTWTLLRAVERKYGKVAEAQFFKDHEIINRYQMYIYIVFRDQESLERIPKEGQSFHIPAPVVEDKSGGPGLDDIKHLLDSTDRDESFEFPSATSPDLKKSKERVIGFRIDRAGNDFYTIPRYEMPLAHKALARQFLRWRGFHALKPIEEKELREDNWLEKAYWDQTRMRIAVQRCSRILQCDNPAVIRKPIAHENDGKVSDTSSASGSMDSPGSSPRTALDIPITHESTSKSTQSRSLLTEFPQSPSQPPPELTQVPPEPTSPEPTIQPTIPPPGQFTPEQKKILQRQMSRAKQINKQLAAKKTQKPGKKQEERPKNQVSLVPDEIPEEPLQESKNAVASFWKFVGR